VTETQEHRPSRWLAVPVRSSAGIRPLREREPISKVRIWNGTQAC